MEFGNQPIFDDLASHASDRSARVIVGKKGVGKTIYLRRFQADAEDQQSVHADQIHHDVPATEDVIRVCELYPPELAAEAWQWIWRRAILRSLVSHLLCTPELRNRIAMEDLAVLEGELRHLYGRYRRARGVYAEARAIAADARNRDRLARELRHRDWDDLEDLLGDILEDLPPICFYLDSVDEQFGSAPLFWLLCQKGLCNQVLELYRDKRFGSRLHVVISIRELVRSSLMQGEHGTRYKRARHIRVLDWDHEAIGYFLHEKIRRLQPRFMMDSNSGGIAGWLGRTELYNSSRGVMEVLEDYLLRHTRLIPRDIVQLGNELSFEVARAKARDEKALTDDAIRRAMGEVAKEFADEQIAVCANHLASDTLPHDAGRHAFSDFYTSALYAGGVQKELCEFIAEVGTDRFPLSRLEEALAASGGEVLKNHPNPLNVLWQNGLLGYDAPHGDHRHSHFYGAHDDADFQLPRTLKNYVFHPIVGHKIRVDAAGEWPVQGFR